MKGALAIDVAAITLAVIGAAAWTVRDASERSKVVPFAAVKTWSYVLPTSLAMNAKARTKLVDGLFLAEVNFDGHPNYLDAPWNKAAGRGITVQFADKDGFKIYEKQIDITSFRTSVDQSGAAAGLNYDFNDFLSAEQYGRLAQMEVSWNLDSDAKVPSSVPAEDRHKEMSAGSRPTTARVARSSSSRHRRCRLLAA